ncbi:hypothetical protein Lal_00012277 [Lupinus albus]|uniref:Putative transcription regulator Others family n=1 Tax=Lupinus albus TaxID=3870 RepID=A0A6A4QM97_LUPAL|nr:putative transcription regulator Others family [Lupinus albus]KAF1872056.1 hypothetical protein Lal_00012277 [Lupinus albus]
MDSEGSRRLNTNDAFLYLKEIKTVFIEEREKYEHFLKIMRDYKDNRITTNDVVSAAEDLFKGHNHLLLGLNKFLPRGYEIKLPLIKEESSEPVLGIEIQLRLIKEESSNPIVGIEIQLPRIKEESSDSIVGIEIKLPLIKQESSEPVVGIEIKLPQIKKESFDPVVGIEIKLPLIKEE